MQSLPVSSFVKARYSRRKSYHEERESVVERRDTGVLSPQGHAGLSELAGVNDLHHLIRHIEAVRDDSHVVDCYGGKGEVGDVFSLLAPSAMYSPV